MPPGHAVGHEGIAEVVAVGDDVTTVRVGDRVVVPFQINCGQCSACRRGVTGSCASLPLMAMYGMAPLAGMDGGGFMSDLVLVPFADAMLLPVPDGVDPVAIASLSDNIPDGGARSVRIGRTGRPRRGLQPLRLWPVRRDPDLRPRRRGPRAGGGLQRARRPRHGAHQQVRQRAGGRRGGQRHHGRSSTTATRSRPAATGTCRPAPGPAGANDREQPTPFTA